MINAKQTEQYCERVKTDEDIEAECAISSALRLTEALNAMLIQTCGNKPGIAKMDVWPVRSIINEIECQLFKAAHHYCGPSKAELDQAMDAHNAERYARDTQDVS